MNHQVLAIDDSEKIQKLIRAILAKEAVDLHSATDVKHGLVLAASMRPDLILLDVDMPGMDGFTACKQLKSNPETADCPVIFLTAHADAKEKVQGFGLGAIDYVTKPFNAAELCMRVRSSLKTCQTIRTLKTKSLTDNLTGLGNRAMFDQRLGAEMALNARTGNPLSVIAIELAQFDSVIANHGARTAKQAIRKVASLLLDQCRPEDVVCRLNTNGFVILTPSTSAPDAKAVAETLRKSVAATPFHAAARDGTKTGEFRINARVGVAETQRPRDHTMLDRAYQALAA